MLDLSCWFGENAQSGNGTTTLRMGTTTDGITFNALSWTYSGTANGGLRDPDMALINGTFAIVFTSGTATSFGLMTCTRIGDAWQDVTPVSCATLPAGTASHCWAPNWFINPTDNSLHVILAIGTNVGINTGFDFYEIHPTTNTDGSVNLTSWSNPVKLATDTSFVLGSGERIDPFITKLGSIYYLFYSQESGVDGPVGLASSTALLGTYTIMDDDWSSTKGMHHFLEGPHLVNRQGTWWFYADNYSQDLNYGGGIYYSTSTDLWVTWSTSSLAKFPSWPQVKHGGLLINGAKVVGTATYTNYETSFSSIANNGTATLPVDYIFADVQVNNNNDVGTAGIVSAAGNLTGFKGDGNGIMGRG